MVSRPAAFAYYEGTIFPFFTVRSCQVGGATMRMPCFV